MIFHTLPETETRKELFTHEDGYLRTDYISYGKYVKMYNWHEFREK